MQFVDCVHGREFIANMKPKRLLCESVHGSVMIHDVYLVMTHHYDMV